MLSSSFCFFVLDCYSVILDPLLLLVLYSFYSIFRIEVRFLTSLFKLIQVGEHKLEMDLVGLSKELLRNLTVHHTELPACDYSEIALNHMINMVDYDVLLLILNLAIFERLYDYLFSIIDIAWLFPEKLLCVNYLHWTLEPCA